MPPPPPPRQGLNEKNMAGKGLWGQARREPNADIAPAPHCSPEGAVDCPPLPTLRDSWRCRRRVSPPFPDSNRGVAHSRVPVLSHWSFGMGVGRGNAYKHRTPPPPPPLILGEPHAVLCLQLLGVLLSRRVRYGGASCAAPALCVKAAVLHRR